MTIVYTNLKLREDLEYITETPNYRLYYVKSRNRYVIQKNRKQASLSLVSLKRACKVMNLKEEKIKKFI